MYLSRSHFDRVTSATAGEDPAAFRRRILMERAAFRLATRQITDLGNGDPRLWVADAA